jgi:hypothetical protein
MITDANLLLSSAQTLIHTDSTVVSTNTVDLGIARDIGEGENLYVEFDLTIALVGGTSVDFQVIISAAEALTGPVIVGASGPILTADGVIGKRIAVRINPKIASKGLRYLGAQYVIVGAMSAGAVNANVVKDIQDGQKFYPSGFSVS